jgi:hypothetical protein
MKKVEQIPPRDYLIEVIEERLPFHDREVAAFSIYRELSSKYALFRVLFHSAASIERILNETDQPEEVADRILSHFPAEPKAREKRSDAYFQQARTKRAVKKKDPIYELLLEMDHIYSLQNLKDWETLGFNVVKRFQLGMEVMARRNNETLPPPFKAKEYEREAYRKMEEETALLERVKALFWQECLKALETANMFFFKVVNELFSEDARRFLPSLTMRGDKLEEGTIDKGMKKFREYITAKNRKVKVANTFYAREKIIGICYLARIAVYELEYADKYRIERKNAIEHIRHLIEDYCILPSEVLPMDPQQQQMLGLGFIYPFSTSSDSK